MMKLSNALLTLLLFVSMNAGASIIYGTDARYTRLNAMGYLEYLRTPSTPFSAFSSSMFGFEAGTYQNSSMDSTSITGTGTTYAGLDANGYSASGRSVFDVTFTVNQLTNFSLSGTMSNYFGGVTGALLANGSEIFSAPYDGAFNLSGQFTVGTQYQLIMISATDYTDYQNMGWQFNLTTTPVPVPGAVWLLGSGLLGLLGVARKRNAA